MNVFMGACPFKHPTVNNLLRLTPKLCFLVKYAKRRNQNPAFERKSIELSSTQR